MSAPSDSPSVVESVVSVTIPAAASYVRIVRLVVSSMAADMGFDIDEVEDLRMVADELVSAVIAAVAPGNTVRISISETNSALTFEVVGPMFDPLMSIEDVQACLDPLATQIVAAVVQSFSIETLGSEVCAKCLSREPGGAAVVI